MTRPVIALTLGDPAGIGPEIVAKAILQNPNPDVSAVAVGDALALERAVSSSKLDASVIVVDGFEGITVDEPKSIYIVDTKVLDGEMPEWGEVNAKAGSASIAAVEAAVSAAVAGTVAAIVTGPINKEAIWAAGSEYLGHTEMLGALTGAPSSDTMFVVRNTGLEGHELKIFFTTRHMALRQALDEVTRESVLSSIRGAYRAMRVFGVPEPRLGVAALNPHGGENGAFGREELDEIGPACEVARGEGLDVVGPVPADSVFHQGLMGKFDGVLSQFHDQGHIPAKTYDFDGTVSVTIGLPILRTSVDHGTAFDIAGRGIADAATMSSALELAAEYIPRVPDIRSSYGPDHN